MLLSPLSKKVFYSTVVMLSAILICIDAGARDTKDSSLKCPTCTGIYWHEEPEKEEPKGKKEDKKEDLQMPQPVIPPPLHEKFTEEELMKLHPKQIQHLVNIYLDKGVGDPTPDNVRDYYTIQNVARLKAQAFTNVADYTVQTTPHLSVARDYPISAPGQESMKRQTQNEIQGKLYASRDEFALLYFYSPNCQYCEVQTQINAFFIDKYQWQIKGIDILEQPNIASRFNVETTPYILLIGKNSDKHIPITVGVVSVPEMEERIYRGVRLLAGEITPEQWSMMEFQRKGAFDVNTIGKGN